MGEVFYSKLFFDYPDLEKKCPLPVDSRDEDLMRIISRIISRLDRRMELLGVLGDQNNYPLLRDHYGKLAQALLWTLEKGLGSDWTVDAEEAWRSCIGMVEDLNRSLVE